MGRHDQSQHATEPETASSHTVTAWENLKAEAAACLEGGRPHLVKLAPEGDEDAAAMAVRAAGCLASQNFVVAAAACESSDDLFGPVGAIARMLLAHFPALKLDYATHL